MSETQNQTSKTQVKVYKIEDNTITIVRNHSNEKIDRRWTENTIRIYEEQRETPVRYTTTEWYVKIHFIDDIIVYVIDVYDIL